MAVSSDIPLICLLFPYRHKFRRGSVPSSLGTRASGGCAFVRVRREDGNAMDGSATKTTQLKGIFIWTQK